MGDYLDLAPRPRRRHQRELRARADGAAHDRGRGLHGRRREERRARLHGLEGEPGRAGRLRVSSDQFHDRGAEDRARTTLPANGGYQDGVAVLDLLASHPEHGEAHRAEARRALRRARRRRPRSSTRQQPRTSRPTAICARCSRRSSSRPSSWTTPPSGARKVKRPLHLIASHRARDGRRPRAAQPRSHPASRPRARRGPLPVSRAERLSRTSRRTGRARAPMSAALQRRRPRRARRRRDRAASTRRPTTPRPRSSTARHALFSRRRVGRDARRCGRVRRRGRRGRPRGPAHRGGVGAARPARNSWCTDADTSRRS